MKEFIKEISKKYNKPSDELLFRLDGDTLYVLEEDYVDLVIIDKIDMRSETVDRILKNTPNSVRIFVDEYVDNILKLSKNIIFVKCYEPFDYTRNLGQLVLEVTYSDGDKDVLSTKSTKDNVSASFDFKDEAEFYRFIEFLQSNNIPRRI